MMQVSPFRQFFLCETGLLTATANFITQHATMKWFRRHLHLIKQEALRAYTQHNVFYACICPGKHLKTHDRFRKMILTIWQ